MAGKIDISQIQAAALKSVPLTFKLTSLPHEAHPLLDRILETYLAELGQENIIEALSYCLKELIVNAQKANTKRLYFAEAGLDITSEPDYEKGMRDFRRQNVERIEHWMQELKERGMAISVTFHTTGGNLRISVRNPAELTQREQTRIYDRIVRARAYNSFVEALSTPIDPTEGAGLGILILLQFLKRIGMGEEAFSIESRDGETVASVSIPKNKVQLEKISVLTEAIVRDVDSLPHFPEAIVELIRMTDERDATIARIATRIATDPALTADLLKLVNSAYYMLPKRVNNILQAVKVVGLKGLRNLLLSYGTQKVLGEKYAEMKSLWDHSYRTAYYAFLLARSVKRLPEILDDVYVAGILHDLGQIIVTYLHPDAMERMALFCKQKDIPARILERFSFGLNHADIGSLMAMKWNFPDALVQGIKYHHDPLVAPVAYKDIVFCVYLANAFCDLERSFINWEQIEKPVLSDFGISSEEQGRKVLDNMRRSFEEQAKRKD
jgi:HD-like signal output (HDOD) protein